MATKGSRARPAAKGKRGTPRWAWLLSGGILIALMVAIAYPLAQQGTSARPVEQFTHIHGLAMPAWAPGEVFLSTHFGLIHIDAEGNWRYISEQPHDFMGFQAHPTEEGVLYSSGHPAPGSNLRDPVGFMISRDGGVTWQVIALAGQVDFHVMAVQATNGDVIYGWNVARPPGLYRSLDGGRNWERRPAERLLELGGAFTLAVHPKDPEGLLAGTRRGLWRSADGGASWEVVLADLPVTAVTHAPESMTRIFAYAVHPEAGLLLSDDAGATWTHLGFVLEDNDAVGYIAIDPHAPEVMYLGSYGENLFKTTDGGGTWQQLAARGVPLRP